MGTIVANISVGAGTLYYHTTPGTAEGSVTTEFGYTDDGVTFEYTAEIADIDVEEETFSIKRVITKEDVTLTVILAEDLLANLENVLSGGATGGAGVVDLGAGAMREMALKFVGNAGGGLTCTIYIPYANPTGTVALDYKKGEITKMAATFKAFQGVSGADVVQITYA